jgi:hypothetical protein
MEDMFLWLFLSHFSSLKSPEVLEKFFIKFSASLINGKLLEGVGSHQCIVSPILHEAEIQYFDISQERLVI